MVLRSIGRVEAKIVAPAKSLDDVRRSSSFLRRVSRRLLLPYGEPSAARGDSPLGFLEAHGKAKNIYSYVVGTLLDHPKRAERWLNMLWKKRKEYRKITAFHGTTSLYLDDMLRRGIRPPSETGIQYEEWNLPGLGNRERQNVYLFIVPNDVVQPNPEYVGSYVHFSELKGKEGGIPVIVGTNLRPTEAIYVAGEGIAMPGDTIFPSVPPDRITHILVPEEYVKEFQKKYKGKKVLPLEPFLLGLALAKHGVNLWHDVLPLEEVLSAIYPRMFLMEMKKKGPEWVIRIHEPESVHTMRIVPLTPLDKRTYKLLLKHHRAGTDVQPKMEKDKVVIHVNGLPVFVLRKGVIQHSELPKDVNRLVLGAYQTARRYGIDPELVERYLMRVMLQHHVLK